MSARVLIAGGGIGALAGALALREYAPPGVELTLLAPGPELVLAPETVLEATGGPPAARYALAAIADDVGARARPGRARGVDAERRDGGHARERPARLRRAADRRRRAARARAPRRAAVRGRARRRRAARGARRARRAPARAVRDGRRRRLDAAALRARAARRRAHPDASVAVATPEPRPAAVFGAVASREVVAPARRRRASTCTRASLPESVEGGALWLAEGGSLAADLVVALPQPAGPAIAGLPADGHGFLPVDRYGRVHGAPAVWAAGDATARPLKQGGLAAQQADVAARSIAATLGGQSTPDAVRARAARRAADRRLAPVPAPLAGLGGAERGERAAAVVGAGQDRRRPRGALPRGARALPGPVAG